MAAWLRNKKFGLRGSSIIWNGFIKTITWLGICLSWKVGDGRDVHIGSDPIDGISEIHYFSPDLRAYLSDYVITTL